MNRKEQILKLFDKIEGKELITRSIDELIFLENKLTDYKTILGAIIISPATLNKYKFYHSLYKDTINQYTQLVKCLCSIINKTGDDSSSPLRDYFKKLQGDE